ncbi:MAG: hypothetical protein QNJ12_21160, partial [Ilumatobacter sp.]|uniref:DUF6880 family protein n=1 Tax=Ilumatobacter sp. TaxID=1967498 RepID=UPI0026267392
MARPGFGGPDEELDELVERLGDGEVRRLLLDAAQRNGDVARTIRLAAAAPADRVATLRSELDGLRTRRHLGYRESMAWADDAMIVVDEIAATAESAPSRELLKLVELAVGRVAKTIMYADDSSGAIGDVARRLLEIHEQLGDAGVADSKALAKWMIRFSFDDQDFFNPDPVRYADALGGSGLAVLRREVDERMAAPDPDFAVRYVQERLAVLDGDVDRVVELLGGALDRPYDFIRVAEAMLELDRPDDALIWARRGIDSVTGWQVAQLYDVVAGVLADRGDDAGVLDLRREQHQRMPSSTTYAKLKTAAASSGAWADELASARAVLGARDVGGLVDALLADGDIDAAWTAATDANPEAIGDQRWARLAEEREVTHPAAALNVYLRLIDSTLEKADRRNYRAAAKQLKRAQKAAAAADLSDEF